MVSIDFKALLAPKILQRDVACINIIKCSSETDIVFNVAPSSVPGIVFQHFEGRSAIEKIAINNRISSEPPLAFLYGAGLEPSEMHYRAGSYTTINFILKPHGLNSLLRIDASELTGTFAALNAFSGTSFIQQLLDVVSVDDQINLVTEFLVTHLESSNHYDDAISAGLQFIDERIASVTVSDVCDYLTLSERQFQRRFRRTVGVSARSYIRVRRFHEAVRLIKVGHHDRLTDIAHMLNYYDQSHLIRDVRSLAGITPKTVLSNEEDLHHAQTGYSFFKSY